MAFSVNGDTPRDLALVEEEINEITKEKINAKVKLMVIRSGNFSRLSKPTIDYEGKK